MVQPHEHRTNRRSTSALERMLIVCGGGVGGGGPNCQTMEIIMGGPTLFADGGEEFHHHPSTIHPTIECVYVCPLERGHEGGRERAGSYKAPLGIQQQRKEGKVSLEIGQ